MVLLSARLPEFRNRMLFSRLDRDFCTLWSLDCRCWVLYSFSYVSSVLSSARSFECSIAQAPFPNPIAIEIVTSCAVSVLVIPRGKSATVEQFQMRSTEVPDGSQVGSPRSGRLGAEPSIRCCWWLEGDDSPLCSLLLTHHVQFYTVFLLCIPLSRNRSYVTSRHQTTPIYLKLFLF